MDRTAGVRWGRARVTDVMPSKVAVIDLWLFVTSNKARLWFVNVYAPREQVIYQKLHRRTATAIVANKSKNEQ